MHYYPRIVYSRTSNLAPRTSKRKILPRLLEKNLNENIMKKGSTSLWETVIRIAIAALTAALTAITTTSCMGFGPVNM